MKKLLFLIIFLSFYLGLSAQNQSDADKDAIKKVIQESYVDGLQNLGSIDAIKKGFHPCFVLLGVSKTNNITLLPVYTWIENVEQKKLENPNGVAAEKKVTIEFDFIDVTGTAAVAKFKFFVGGKLMFTDYLSLYKFNEGWRIVSKIYYRYE